MARLLESAWIEPDEDVVQTNSSICAWCGEHIDLNTQKSELGYDYMSGESGNYHAECAEKNNENYFKFRLCTRKK